MTQSLRRRVDCLLVAAALASASTSAHADWEIQFVRSACVPEADYFEIEYRDVPSMMTNAEPTESVELEPKMKEAWEARGFHSPRDMSVTCQVGEHVFHAVATQQDSSGHFCMAYPPIWLTVTRDGQPWLRAITGGQECDPGSKASVDSIQIGREAVRLCASKNDGDLPVCEYLWNPQQVFPLRQVDIEAFTGASGSTDNSGSTGLEALLAGRKAKKSSTSEGH